MSDIYVMQRANGDVFALTITDAFASASVPQIVRNHSTSFGVL